MTLQAEQIEKVLGQNGLSPVSLSLSEQQFICVIAILVIYYCANPAKIYQIE